MKYLVTGNAGFIGFDVVKKLLKRGNSVCGLDVVNDYYDVNLKEARLQELEKLAAETGTDYAFIRGDIADQKTVQDCFEKHKPEIVINLAAQAGIRYSIENPLAYAQSNLIGFTNIIEGCRHHNVKHLAYASTSSVYGANQKMPYDERDGVDHPLQFYAATKRANELIAHSYSHLFDLPTTGMRFFTVYGPWGRPDMALFKFTKCIIEGTPLQLYNHGNHTRDFTFVDDITQSVLRLADAPPSADKNWDWQAPLPNGSQAPYSIYNLGNSSPVKLTDYVAAIENAVGQKAKLEMLPRQPGDALDTHADCSSLENYIQFKPATSLQDGINQFVAWYREYYKV